ncbi:DUF1501 domain-containing protein [uncultured Fibrella sp.]|uniref:DUF1501 domain-containing protein n=1 Tax=uncultured Fibrella sp. TaxID=1284596 RepID=UPI0035CB8274
MNRRHFLQHASASMLLPVFIDGFGAKAFGTPNSAFMQTLIQLATATDRVLVMIQLNGGNDGLNMVVPLDQMSKYTALRTNIALPEAKVLKLTGNALTGLHPSMTGLQSLYNDGKLSIVHSVSYPTPNFSHFRASDIWFTGADSSQVLTTGWTGRYLDAEWPGYPTGYPTKDVPDPLAIQIGYITSTAFAGPGGPMAVAIPNPDTFAQLVGDKPAIDLAPPPNTPAGQHISYIRQQQLSSVAYAAQIKAAAAKGKNLVTYPTGNSLADQLKIVSRLIHGGLQTRVYYVTIGGFDTHAAQTTTTDTTTGTHANLMKLVSDAIKVFQDDLKVQGTEDRVAGMTFSEFGRRAISNASYGTDHGAAAPLFVFGKGVKTSVIGKNPNLSDLDNNNIKMQTDFRQVYAALLTDWLGAGKPEVTSVLQKSFDIVPIFKQVITATEPLAAPFRVYPNPASDNVTLEGDALLAGVSGVQVYDQAGRAMGVPVSRLSDRALGMNVQTLATGTYVVAIQAGDQRLSTRMLVAR